jgi:hypothetical protein
MKLFKMKFFIFLYLAYSVLSDNFRLYDTSGDIEFIQVQEYQINIKDFQGELTDYFLNHAVASIKVLVTTDCTEKCSQPIRVYGRLNSSPKPEEKLYDKKDINGRFDSGKFLYGFEYSPCQLKKDDVIYIKIIGIEGKAKFNLTVNYNSLKNYKVMCTTGEELLKAIYSASALTKLGTIRYGGLFNNTIDDMYLLNDTNWMKVDQGYFRPEPRYGHFMTYYDDYLIVFGGRDIKENNLNDLWLFDLSSRDWINIDYKNKTNAPSPRFLPSGELVSSHGKIIFFGNKDSEDRTIYFLDIKILLQIVDLQNNKHIDYDNKLHKLWTRLELKDILPRYGLSITHLGNDEVMLFGGFDKSGYAVSRQEILNLNTLELEIIKKDIFPQARGFHATLRVGSIVLLYGGKLGSGENLNDMWKFIIDTRRWVKMTETKDDMFYLFKSNFIFTKLSSERPAIYGGEDNNREMTNDLILLDFDICPTDTNILDVTDCIPCAEGYELSRQMKCEACLPGTYLDINRKMYSSSKCENCPKRTFNNKYAQSDISSCHICPYKTFNDKTGMKQCLPCGIDSICLPGADKPLTDEFLIENIANPLVGESNYPEYIEKNNEIKTYSLKVAWIFVPSFTVLTVIVLLICYKLRPNPVTKFLIFMDFLPLTGGNEKRCNGGLITIIYSILIFALSSSFIFRYFYFNEIIEVIPITESTNRQVDIESSVRLDIDLVGYQYGCIDSKVIEDLYTCDKEIEAKMLNSSKNDVYCSISPEGYCRITLICEDCKTIHTMDTLTVNLKNKDAFVQVYKWHFLSIWNVIFDKTQGYSELNGVAKATNDIE